MRKFAALVFSVGLLAAPASAVAGKGYGNVGKATANCNVGGDLGGSLTCVVPK